MSNATTTPPPQRVGQTRAELERHLYEQVWFLKTSADAYDRGITAEAKRMATHLRTLLHDGKKGSQSRSLLGQLGEKGKMRFMDSSIRVSATAMAYAYYSSLVTSFVPVKGSKAKHEFLPLLDDDGPESPGWLSFEEWWGGEVFFGPEHRLTRSDFVRTMGDQDGGQHVDAKLERFYADVKRTNALTITAGGQPIRGIELAIVRQIGHEVLKSLDSRYEKRRAPRPEGVLLGRISVHSVDDRRQQRG